MESLQPNSHHYGISGVLADLSKRNSEDRGMEGLWAFPKVQTDVTTQLPRGMQTIANRHPASVCRVVNITSIAVPSDSLGELPDCSWRLPSPRLAGAGLPDSDANFSVKAGSA